MASPARIAAVLAAFALAACGGDEPRVPDVAPGQTGVRADGTVSPETAALTCREVGGTRMYPDADVQKTELLAIEVAGEFEGKIDLEPANVTKGLVARTLSACEEAGDPGHQPVDDIRATAQAAADAESPLVVIFGGEDDAPAEDDAEPAGTPVEDLAGQISEACATAPEDLAGQIAEAETLSVDVSESMRLEIASIVGSIAIYGPEAVAFGGRMEDFGRTANEAAIGRDIGGTSPDPEVTTRAREDVLEAAEELGADGCVTLFGG